MEIKDRLIKIITSEGLTSAAFADSIGVQRSSISHIISGRNKPSLDFLQKILISFPKYNAEWLLLGKGEVYKPPTQPSLFAEDTRPSDPIESGIHNTLYDTENETTTLPRTENKPLVQPETSKNEDKQPTINELLEESLIKTTISTKKVKKIVIFYEDNTFGAYLPE